MGNVRYHVALAFGVGRGGELVPVLEEAAKDQSAAVHLAQRLAPSYAGAVAFSRTMDLARRRYGPADVHFVTGKIPRDLQSMCGLEPVREPRTPGEQPDHTASPTAVDVSTDADVVKPARWHR